MQRSYTYQIAIGSRNSAKIKAVKKAFFLLFPHTTCVFYPIEVNTGVAVQPFGLDSTIQGAITRAKNAYKTIFSSESSSSTQLGIGIEAGLVSVPYTATGYLDFQFCALFQADGSISIGSGPAFEYPQKIIDNLLSNSEHHEIGTIIEELSSIPNIKQKEGAIGFLTDGVLERSDILQYSVIMAILPLKNPKLYSS
ncbi:MAG: inosine/xanthosine triphosphatase [Candidatus Lokiarchaeota archaeon]|nr:inosine/xanthosine triphosphatase [Candidatus Lokiarchaeota archaeon]